MNYFYSVQNTVFFPSTVKHLLIGSNQKKKLSFSAALQKFHYYIYTYYKILFLTFFSLLSFIICIMATTTVTSHQPTPIQLTEQKIHRHRSFHYDQRHSNNNSATNSRHQQVQQIGNYVIYKKTLGSGSMGTVKLAECLSDKDHQLVSFSKEPKKSP